MQTKDKSTYFNTTGLISSSRSLFEVCQHLFLDFGVFVLKKKHAQGLLAVLKLLCERSYKPRQKCMEEKKTKSRVSSFWSMIIFCWNRSVCVKLILSICNTLQVVISWILELRIFYLISSNFWHVEKIICPWSKIFPLEIRK